MTAVSFIRAVLTLVRSVRRMEKQLTRMENRMTTQSDQLATIVTSLTTNFGKLDAAIQNIVAQGSSDPSLQASIEALGNLNTLVQGDLAKLTPAAADAAGAAASNG